MMLENGIKENAKMTPKITKVFFAQQRIPVPPRIVKQKSFSL